MTAQRLLLVAAPLALVAASGCDYFLMGTHTGFCDEPTSLAADAGEPTALRKAQCQVMASGPMGMGPGDVCCRKGPTLPADARTQCLSPADCYVAHLGDSCFGDVDCDVGLACLNTDGSPVKFMSMQTVGRTMGMCQCPADAMSCARPDGTMFCCGGGTICGATDCMEPSSGQDAFIPPPVVDMATPKGGRDLAMTGP